ncbi:MAG: hypothetical protein BGP16_13440 [Sphingobium sp. 66-54]|mgnify:CR=1 FL=1|nr:MAG: hypothetical protein BGP16_13440 [Sphingobium sp. 66-54]
MQIYQPSLIARNDTLLGVCAAIGEDFGFNPIWLRAAFAVVVFFNLVLAVGIYLAMGAVVLLTRWLYPKPRRLMVVPQAVAAAENIEGEGESEDLVLLAAA